MDPELLSPSEPQPPKVEPGATPSDAELSRIARQAVHQPADPRLDRQLERMGLTEPPEPAGSAGQAAPITPAAAAAAQRGEAARRALAPDPEIVRLQAKLRHIEMIVGALVVAVGILSVIAVILLLR